MRRIAFFAFSYSTLAAAGCMPASYAEPDAYRPIPIPDGAAFDASTDAPRSDAHVDASVDARSSSDMGGSTCSTTNLHSDLGASVAHGTTVGMSDRHTPSVDCADPGSPDAWFTWTAPAGGTYAIDTSGSGFDTVVDVIANCTGGSLACNDDGALGDGTSNASVVVGNGQTIVIIVDGYGGESGSFVLGIHRAMPEICGDHLDNDSDGLTDCDDFDDCAADPSCTETACSDGIDNDGDTDTDCADFDCAADPSCFESDCTNTLDDDGDGAADCADPDCELAPLCDESMHCADGIDNDHDGTIDCEDFRCSAAANCDESTRCGDHIDNDFDDDVDCADTDCETNAACTTPEANCTNGIDDDDDGVIDCADFDCAAQCGEDTAVACMNTTDDDGDGQIDCADRECTCSSACPPAVAPGTTCPDMDLASAVGVGVFHGNVAPYSCGARADASCATGGGRGAEIELAWTAPADAHYVLDTNDTGHAGGTFDTVLSLRDDCTIDGTEIDCNDDDGTGHLSRVEVDLTAGQHVLIVIDSYAASDGGHVTLNITQM
jgi:hypothetical protein